MTCSCSTVEMRSEEVRKLAQACLDRILASRERRFQTAVDELREVYRRRLVRPWLRPLWGILGPIARFLDVKVRLELPSDDELRDELGEERRWIDMRYAGQEQTARSLLKASSRAETVRVAVGDLDDVS